MKMLPVAITLFAAFAASAAALGCPSCESLTLCTVPTTDESTLVQSVAARFALGYYTDSAIAGGGYAAGTQYGFNVPNVTWSFRALGNGEHTPRNVVRAWAIDGTAAGCDAFIGPGYSSLSQAMSPMVLPTTVWVASFASSDSLSDNKAHPAFNRVVPSDKVAVSMAVAVFRRFEWTTVNVFCFDDSYGQSLTAGLRTSMTAAGGRVDRVHCTGDITAITAAAVRSILDSFIAQSTSRVVFMAMYPGTAFATIIQTIKAGGYDAQLIFVFSEAACTTSDRTYAALSSALCTTYLANATLSNPFNDAYSARDLTGVRSMLQGTGLGSVTTSLTSPSLLTSLTHDATLHAMRSLVAYRLQNCTMPWTTTPYYSAVIDVVRGLHTDGFTGPIDLDSNGDRTVTNAVMYNAVDGVSRPIAGIFGSNVQFIGADGQPTAGNAVPTLQLMGQSYTAPPSALFPEAPSKFWTGTVIIAFVAGGVVLLLLIAVVVFIATREGSARDNSNAPKDTTKPFAMVFTDIQASTTLWARVPEQMSEAVDVHHATIRHLIAKHKGYEVKTIGDSFMVAFHDADAAVAFGLGVQMDLFGAAWEAADVFDEHYKQMMLEANIDPAHVHDVDAYSAAWRGLRVRIGIHHGLGKVQVDPVTKGYDYYGTVVNTASRVEAIGHGGQTLVTRAVLENLSSMDIRKSTIGGAIPGAVVADQGAQSLRGLEEPVWLFQVLPAAVAGRVFPSLRLEIEVDDDELNISSTGDDNRRKSRVSTDAGGTAKSDSAAPMLSVTQEMSVLATRIAQRRFNRNTQIQQAPSRAISFFAPAAMEPRRSLALSGRSRDSAGSPTRAPMSPPGAVSDHGASEGGTAIASCADELVESLRATNSLSLAPPDQELPRSPPARKKSSTTVERPPELKRCASETPSNPATASALNPAIERDRDALLFLASFMRTLLSVVPLKERQRAMGHYAKRWHAKVTAPTQVRASADSKYRTDIAEVKTTMSVVERVWLALENGAADHSTSNPFGASLAHTHGRTSVALR